MSPSYMHSAAAQRDPERYAAMRRAQRKRYYAATAYIYPPRRWEPWEDDMVLNSGLLDRELSQTLQRSMKAIGNRRWRLRKLYPEAGYPERENGGDDS